MFIGWSKVRHSTSAAKLRHSSKCCCCVELLMLCECEVQAYLRNLNISLPTQLTILTLLLSD